MHGNKDRLSRRKVLVASGTALALSGMSMNAAAFDGHQRATPERIGETNQIAVYEHEDGLFLYDKRNLNETGQIHAYAGPKPGYTTTVGNLDESQLEQLIDYYSDPQGVQAQQDDDISTTSVIPGVSFEIGGKQIGQSSVIDSPQYGIYIAAESPGLPFNPGIGLIVDAICTIINELRSAGSSAAVQPSAVPVAFAAAVLKTMTVAYSCSLLFEPLAYAIIDGDATMVFHDDDWFHWQGLERLPAIMNATENDYLTDDPWDEVLTGVLITPASLHVLYEHQYPTVPYPYVWGNVVDLS